MSIILLGIWLGRGGLFICTFVLSHDIHDGIARVCILFPYVTL